ncbi:PAS domain S-box protein [Acidobacteriota bacterium]
MNNESPVKDKYYQALLELHKLMSELEQIEMAMQQSGKQPWKTEKEYQAFFDRAKVGMVLIQNERVVHINTPLSDIIGYSPEEIIGTPFMKYIHPSELPRVMKNYNNRVKGKEAPIIYKTMFEHKSGRGVYVMAKAGAIIYREKSAIFAVIEETTDNK